MNNNLKINLVKKYKTIINQVKSGLQSIKSNQILEKYYKNLTIAEKHLNSINELFEIFNKYISDGEYNKRFLPSINNFIQNINSNISQIL